MDSPYIWTREGKKFLIGDPLKSAVTLRDIARSLSRQPRFTGHTWAFYSEAQHSVLLSRLVPPEFALVALLDDAYKAVLGPITRPVRVLMRNAVGGVLDHAIEKVRAAIYRRFGVEAPAASRGPLFVAARSLEATEAADLLFGNLNERVWPLPDKEWMSELSVGEPLAERIVPWADFISENKFVDRAVELGYPQRQKEAQATEAMTQPPDSKLT